MARRTVNFQLLSYVPATALIVHLSAAQQEKPHLQVGAASFPWLAVCSSRKAPACH